MHTPECAPPSGTGLAAPFTPGVPPPTTPPQSGPPPTTPPGLLPIIVIDVIDVWCTRGQPRFTLEVKATDTIDNVKAKIQSQENIMQDQQTLWWDEQKLEDGGRAIGDYGVKHGSLVWMDVSAPRT